MLEHVMKTVLHSPEVGPDSKILGESW